MPTRFSSLLSAVFLSLSLSLLFAASALGAPPHAHGPAHAHQAVARALAGKTVPVKRVATSSPRSARRVRLGKPGRAGAERRAEPLSKDDVYYEWAVDVTVGKRDLTLVFDTGSDRLVLDPGTYAPTPRSKDLHASAENDYGFGSVATHLSVALYEDDVTLGGVTVSAVVGVSRGELSWLHSDNSHGLIGVSPGDDTGAPAPTSAGEGAHHEPIAALGKSGKWDGEYVVDLRLGEGGGGGSSVTFASPPDRAQYKYAPAADDGWSVQGTAAGVPFRGIIDTGTMALTATTASAQRIAKKLGLRTVRQDDATQLIGKCGTDPGLVLNFAGQDIRIKQEALWPYAYDKEEGMCVFCLAGSDGVNEEWWVIGDPIFLSAMIGFDYKNRRIGFKPK